MLPAPTDTTAGRRIGTDRAPRGIHPARSAHTAPTLKSMQPTRPAASFHLVSDWVLPATPERVWAVWSDIAAWPNWWRGPRGRGMEHATLVDAHTVDLVTSGTLPYRLRYRLTLVTMDAPRLLIVRSTGALRGIGTWTLTPTAAGGTLAHFEWDVEPSGLLLRVAARLARGELVRNHQRVMEWGRIGLSAQLSAGAA